MLSALGKLSRDRRISRAEIKADMFTPPLPFQPLRVRGCILTLVERMDEEFTKIMQNTDPHSQGKPAQVWVSVRGKVQGIILECLESQPFLTPPHSHWRT